MAKFWSLIQQDKRFPDPKVGEVMEYKSGERKKWGGSHGWVTFGEFNKLKEEGAFRLGQDYVRKAEQGYLQLGKNILSTVPSNVKEAVSNQAQVAAQGFVRDYQNLPENVQEGVEGVARTAIAPFQLLQQGIEKASDITGVGTKPLDLAVGAAEAFITGGSSKLIREGLQPGKKLLQETGELLDNRVVQAVSPDGSTINLPSSAVPLQSKGVNQVRKGNLDVSTDPFSKRRGTAKRFTELGEDLSASAHHMGDAGTTGTAINMHPQGKRIRRALFAKGQETGDSIYNYVTAYDTLINRAHTAKRQGLMKAFGIDQRTADDLLKVPKQITRKTKLTKAQMGEHSKILESYRTSIPPKVKPGEFPPIRNQKGEVIFQATSQKEWDSRFKRVAEIVGADNPNLATQQANTLIRNINADPSLNIFSQDHMTHFHENYSKLTSVKRLNAALKDGSYAKLSVKDATNMLSEALTDQRAVVVNYSRQKTRSLLKRFPELKNMSLDQIKAFQKANPQEFALGIRREGYDVSLNYLNRRETAILNDPLGEMVTKIFGIQDIPAPKSQMKFTLSGALKYWASQAK